MSTNRYSYSVERSPDFTGLHHFRESRKESLIKSAKIAQTRAILRPSAELKPFPLIVLPSAEDTEHVTKTRLDTEPVPSDIPEGDICDDLETFVTKSVDRWRQLIQNVGNIVRVELHLGEFRDNDSGRFVGFEPEEPEILAMERIYHEVNREISKLSVPLPATGTMGEGHYL